MIKTEGLTHSSEISPEIPGYRELAGAQVSAGRALRYNSGKIPIDLVPFDAIEAEALVWKAGAIKYPRDERGPTMLKLGNWEKLWGDDTVSIALGCAFRHMGELRKGNWTEVQKDKDGNVIRDERGEPIITQHAASVRSNMAIIIRYFNECIQGKTNDQSNDGIVSP